MIWTGENPLRPANWVWLTAEFLSNEDRTRSPAGAPKKIRDAWGFYRQQHGGDADKSKKGAKGEKAAPKKGRKSKSYEDDYSVYRIYKGKSVLRYSMEALILANAPVLEMAEELGIPVELVRLYEERFFDIRSRLDHTFLVADLVYAPALTRGVSGDDPDLYWKMVGHLFGLDILRAVWNVGNVSDATRFAIVQKVRDRLHTNALGAVHSRSINRHTSEKMVEEFLSLSAQDRADEGAGRVQEALSGVSSMLGAVGISIMTAERGQLSMLAPGDLHSVVKRLAPASEYVTSIEVEEGSL